ncbi:MAG TPA: SRPBCC domain-containing protein [Rhodospirillales bacterium]|nr:SRPBCC domain-containing protein [Rhodospirillales bacterium]
MANITHAINISVKIKKAMLAITSLPGLNSWWTTETTGDPAQGGVLAFRFGDHGGPDMSVDKVTESAVIWSCIAGPEEWLGTTIEFSFQVDDRGNTELRFTHRGWAEETPFHYHCSMKWASFLLSLKEYFDLGQGRPFPDDIQINGPTAKKTA